MIRTGAARGAGRRVPFGLGVLAVATVITLVGIGRPAYWADEATTVMLVRWSWSDLLGVIRGPEAPLGPYYLLMKPWTGLGGTAEWWVRLPSALAMAGAVAVLAGWARRRLGRAVALAGAGVLLALPAVSRYAQEARPYGLMLLAVTGCGLAWWRWRQRPGRGAAVGYAVTVAVLPLLHVLALTLVVAQVIAALLPWGPPSGDRERRGGGGTGPAVGTAGSAVRTAGPAVWTVGLAGAGLLPMLPYLVLVGRQAMGVAFPLPLSWANAWSTGASMIAGPPRGDRLGQGIALAVVVLAAVGLSGWRDPRRRPLLAYLACWAVVPPVLLTVAAARLETLVPRYFMVALPGWALLAGAGCVELGRAVARRGPAGGAGARVAGGTTALLVGVLALAGWPHQVAYRAAAGHANGDPRPAVRLLDAPAYRSLPVVVLPQAWWVILADAYDPAIPRRTLLAVGPRLGPDRHIVLHEVDAGTAAARLAGIGAIAVLVHTGDVTVAGEAARQSPPLAGFDVRRVAAFDGWSVVLLTRGGAD